MDELNTDYGCRCLLRYLPVSSAVCPVCRRFLRETNFKPFDNVQESAGFSLRHHPPARPRSAQPPPTIPHAESSWCWVVEWWTHWTHSLSCWRISWLDCLPAEYLNHSRLVTTVCLCQGPGGVDILLCSYVLLHLIIICLLHSVTWPGLWSAAENAPLSAA